ncbi:MAG: hypothetical protein AAFX53_19555, partial [Bacteroidota bacterium]
VRYKGKKQYKSLSGKILSERIKLYAQSFKTNAHYSIDFADKELRQGTQVRIVMPYIIEN